MGNLIIWIIDAPGPHPHLRYESKTMYFAIDFLAKTLAEGGDTDRLKPLISEGASADVTALKKSAK